MNPIRTLRTLSGLTQSQLAAAARTTQPTIAAYERGTKSPTWRSVERLAHAAGYEATVGFTPPLTREDRRSLALHDAVAVRLQADSETVLARAAASLARMRSLHPGAHQLLDEWALLLRRPLSALLPVLRDPSPWSRELRHVTPFTGVLSAQERARVYREFALSDRTRINPVDALSEHAS